MSWPCVGPEPCSVSELAFAGWRRCRPPIVAAVPAKVTTTAEPFGSGAKTGSCANAAERLLHVHT